MVAKPSALSYICIVNCSKTAKKHFAPPVVKSEALLYICNIMDKRWKTQVRREASSHHMCEENRRALSGIDSKPEAVALYLKTLDWALEEGYPSLPTLREHFSDCEDYGIFVGKKFSGEVLDDKTVYVFHNCTGYIKVGLNVEKKIIPILYFANDCDMTIRSSGNSSILPPRIPVYVFGNNVISVEHTDEIECKIYKFDVK